MYKLRELWEVCKEKSILHFGQIDHLNPSTSIEKPRMCKAVHVVHKSFALL